MGHSICGRTEVHIRCALLLGYQGHTKMQQGGQRQLRHSKVLCGHDLLWWRRQPVQWHSHLLLRDREQSRMQQCWQTRMLQDGSVLRRSIMQGTSTYAYTTQPNASSPTG